MKGITTLVAGFLVVLASGCETTPVRQEGSPFNAWLAASVTENAVNQAIIAQHTIYPYHFVASAAVLNELGQHDLQVLADHYAEHPGPLNIRQGNAPPNLYEARKTAVIDSLVKAGVDTSRVTIGDALPGGEGMPSEGVITILEAEPASAAGTTWNQTGGAQMTGAPE